MEGLQPMETALLLMIVGMGTVFIILILIIYLSRLMIMAVNKFAPEEETVSKKAAAPVPAAVPANVEAAIKAAIAQVAPKAMVTKITKG
jgi:oxaloacetate decarboxylase gamma subunit